MLKRQCVRHYSITPILHFCSFAGFPLASAASRPATETQGPTAQLKTRCEAGNKAQKPTLASAVAPVAGTANPPDLKITRQDGLFIAPGYNCGITQPNAALYIRP